MCLLLSNQLSSTRMQLNRKVLDLLIFGDTLSFLAFTFILSEIKLLLYKSMKFLQFSIASLMIVFFWILIGLLLRCVYLQLVYLQFQFLFPYHVPLFDLALRRLLLLSQQL